MPRIYKARRMSSLSLADSNSRIHLLEYCSVSDSLQLSYLTFQFQLKLFIYKSNNIRIMYRLMHGCFLRRANMSCLAEY